MLNLSTYLIREQVGWFKLVDTYDIFDPNSGQQVGVAKEESPTFLKLARLFVNKQLLPTSVGVYANGSEKAVFTIHRGLTFLRSKVKVHDADDNYIGYFKSKLFSIGGGFYVYDPADNLFAEVKGDWKGWNFKLTAKDGRELGTVSKQWGGLAKEMFTSADNYIIAINDAVQAKEGGNLLLLAAGLAIDIIYKEKSS